MSSFTSLPSMPFPSSSSSSLGHYSPSVISAHMSTPTPSSGLASISTAAPASASASMITSQPRWSSWPSWPRSWSGSRTSKHTRVRRACESCRSRKTGCSGEEPCKSCFRLNRPCVYTEVSEEKARAARDRKLKAKKGDSRPEITENDLGNSLLVKGWSPQIETLSPSPISRSPPRNLPSVLRPVYFVASPRPPSFSSSSSSCATTTATISTATFLPTPSPLSSTSFDPSCSSVLSDPHSHSFPYPHPFSPVDSYPETSTGSPWSSHFPRSPEQNDPRWSSTILRSPEPEELPPSRSISSRPSRPRRPAHSWSISSIHSVLPPSSLSSSSSCSSLSPSPSPLTWPGPAAEVICPEVLSHPAHHSNHGLSRASRSSSVGGIPNGLPEDQTNQSVPVSADTGPGLGLGLSLGTGFDINVGLRSMSVHREPSERVELTYKLWGAD